MADRKSCWLVPSPESQVCHVASASKKVSRGQGQKRDGRRKCSDLQETVKPGLLCLDSLPGWPAGSTCHLCRSGPRKLCWEACGFTPSALGGPFSLFFLSAGSLTQPCGFSEGKATLVPFSLPVC